MRLFRCNLILALALATELSLRAQTPPPTPVLSVIEASFDPPVVRPGEKTFYRISVAAPAASIQWPQRFYTPITLEMEQKARGEIQHIVNSQFGPQTSYLWEVIAASPGRFIIPPFQIAVQGRLVEIPAATLMVAEGNAVSNPPQRQIVLELPRTNLYAGETFSARVIFEAGPGNQIEVLREVQFNGARFLAGKTASRMSVETVTNAGRKFQAFIQEMPLTPIASGDLTLSAQGFSAGREFSGPITITAGSGGPIMLGGNTGPTRYVLMISEPVPLKVRPLPEENRLPGFTGIIGKIALNPPTISTNRVRVGEPFLLKTSVRGGIPGVKAMPPTPQRLRDWEIIPEAKQPGIAFTLIPLSDDPRATPAIPFSCFDPETGKYVDLTIPPVPVTILGDGMPAALPRVDDEPAEVAPPKLSSLATSAGKTAGSLTPLQFRTWFVGLQLLPVIGFLALWQWDRRRRYLEAQPEIVRRRKAKRALRREKTKLRKAAITGNAAAFVRHAADALRIACAPHFPAHPRALVCADVLACLDAHERTREAVRRIFEADDAQFAATPEAQAGLLALENDVSDALEKLEEQL